jgi:hypothetical protein
MGMDNALTAPQVRRAITGHLKKKTTKGTETRECFINKHRLNQTASGLVYTHTYGHGCIVQECEVSLYKALQDDSSPCRHLQAQESGVMTLHPAGS